MDMYPAGWQTCLGRGAWGVGPGARSRKRWASFREDTVSWLDASADRIRSLTAGIDVFIAVAPARPPWWHRPMYAGLIDP